MTSFFSEEGKILTSTRRSELGTLLEELEDTLVDEETDVTLEDVSVLDTTQECRRLLTRSLWVQVKELKEQVKQKEDQVAEESRRADTAEKALSVKRKVCACDIESASKIKRLLPAVSRFKAQHVLGRHATWKPRNTVADFRKVRVKRLRRAGGRSGVATKKTRREEVYVTKEALTGVETGLRGTGSKRRGLWGVTGTAEGDRYSLVVVVFWHSFLFLSLFVCFVLVWLFLFCFFPFFGLFVSCLFVHSLVG